MKTFVLYCEELPERKEAAKKHLTERGVFPVWWRAAHGSTWGLSTTLEYEKGKRIPPGHVALNTSWWFLLQHAYLTLEDDKSECVIFEDDVDVPHDFKWQLTSVHAELSVSMPDWDLVFLGLAEIDVHVWQKITERVGGPSSRLCRMEYPFGTHALLIRKRAIPKILDRMTVAQKNLDQQLYERVLRTGCLKWCAVLPSIVTQRTFDYRGEGHPTWEPSCIPEEEKKAPPPKSEQDDPAKKARPELIAATTQLVDPINCLYRGEYTEEIGYGPKNKTVPLAQCAYLGVLCHTRSYDVAVGRGLDATLVKACRDCESRSGMKRGQPRSKLPVPEGHFNPSIALWQGRLVLATRDSWGHSKVGIWHLDNKRSDWTGDWIATPVGSYESAHPLAPRLEDPRLFVATNPETRQKQLHAAFNLPDGYPPKKVRVGYCRFTPELTGIEHTEVFESPYGNAYEKNWMFWEDGEGLNFGYAFHPEHIVFGQHTNWKTPNPLPWSAGIIRGGASPVLHDGVYYHFFHGVLKSLRGARYTLGCQTFEAKPPYRILKQTPRPLVWPDEPDYGEVTVKRYVVFVGGAVPHAGAWYLVAGVDDTNCRMIRIPFEDVEKSLSDVPEENPTVTLSNTVLATGGRG
jgi:predicted GH43/DUF377 family glycosyl hydrolase